ncbi:3'-5' exoribonuclease HELZ2-like [Engraulis encrasicolus]|uniref:3'-5' exoribonuclease HELZ2-like n=1 Tax=Engraulis encrasicolus TaxID=184585 RepID=UPI002FD195E8
MEQSELIKRAPKHSPKLADCTDGVDTILKQFPGIFFELCETCFHNSPQRISERQTANASKRLKCCTSKHPWKPILVYSGSQGQNVEYHVIRPRPNKPYSQWRYCKYVKREQTCWHGHRRCWFAHSAVEMAVWTEESKRPFDRSRLLTTTKDAKMLQGPLANPTPPKKSLRCTEMHYRKVCQCYSYSKEDYMNHCFTSEHRRRIFEGEFINPKYRDPPPKPYSFQMCPRPGTCKRGDGCVQAHSEEELQEWRSRSKAARRKVKVAEEQELLSYQDQLLGEYRSSPKPHDIRALKVTALLKQELGCSFTLGDDSKGNRTYLSHGDHKKPTYEINVSFEAFHPGVFEQWLVFDFDTRPVLLRKLQVKVGVAPSLRPLPEICDKHPASTGFLPPDLVEPRLWNRGDIVIVPYCTKAEAKPLSEFRRPEINCQYDQLFDDLDPITCVNYRDRMHNFVYQEELAEENIVCRLNVRGAVKFSKALCEKTFGLKIAPEGELFGALQTSHILTPDTPEGVMLRRRVKSVLVGEMTTDDQRQAVYEARILPDTASEKSIHLQLSSKCCADLGLENDQTREMEVQFQLNRLWFCEMHKAINLLPDFCHVLPDFRTKRVPVYTNKRTTEKHQQYLNDLNEKQQAAMAIILGHTEGNTSVAPLLIYGPFGTGKTHTLVVAVVELMKEDRNRVLIFTHTNSCADLYVKHFHKYKSSSDLNVEPLRIKAKEASPRSTDPITDDSESFKLPNDSQSFELPSRETMDKTRILIMTTGVACLLKDLNLPIDYFSHILIDEASHMLECETLMAVGLAGPATQVVLAGDHMQMGSKLFSVDDEKRSDHTLLNRLFHAYQLEKNAMATQNKIIFNENYRSTKEIVDFVSSCFYVKGETVIKAKGNVAAHPKQYPLMFSHVRGECHLDTKTMSWYNPEQVANVVDIVLELLCNLWKQRDLSQGIEHFASDICILSQGTQVRRLRSALRNVNLHSVTVENAENVHGKQYRVIILVTVLSKDTLKPFTSNCLEFFNDARVLNMAMTRAQSQVIVVGDAAALCCFGRCSTIWRRYLEHCIEKQSARPEYLTQSFLKYEIMEISRPVRAQEGDISDPVSTISCMPDNDVILQELLDESKQRINCQRINCQSCVHIQDHGNCCVLQPSVSLKRKECVYTVSSPAGSYECSESGLRWSCPGPVTLQYHISKEEIFWAQLQILQYRPVGPPLKIKLLSGELEEVHLPHSLCLAGTNLAVLGDAVRALHGDDSGVSLETCELTRFHGKLRAQHFSIWQLVASWGVPVKSHCEVLIYEHCPRPLILHTFLLPSPSSAIQAVQEKWGVRSITKPSPDHSLWIDSTLQLTSPDSLEIEPSDLTLSYRNPPTYSEVFVRNPLEEFKLEIKDTDDHTVWEVELRQGVDYNRTQDRTETPDTQEAHSDEPAQRSRIPVQVGSRMIAAFLEETRPELIQSVTEVMPIADQLLSQRVICQETYANIQAATTSQDKMRSLFEGLRSAGAQGKLAFYRILQAQQPHLLEDLWTTR